MCVPVVPLQNSQDRLKGSLSGPTCLVKKRKKVLTLSRLLSVPPKFRLLLITVPNCSVSKCDFTWTAGKM